MEERGQKEEKIVKKEYKIHSLSTQDKKALQTISHLHLLCISRLLIRINMPHNVIRQPINPVSCSLSHLRKALGLGLILE